VSIEPSSIAALNFAMMPVFVPAGTMIPLAIHFDDHWNIVHLKQE
jgi:hypothetical protein